MNENEEKREVYRRDLWKMEGKWEITIASRNSNGSGEGKDWEGNVFSYQVMKAKLHQISISLQNTMIQ